MTCGRSRASPPYYLLLTTYYLLLTTYYSVLTTYYLPAEEAVRVLLEVEGVERHATLAREAGRPHAMRKEVQRLPRK
jgi:hypothetical protein